MKFDAKLDDHRYDKITDDIQSHNSHYRLPKYPNKADADVEEYITILQDITYLVTQNLIISKLAYDYFSYDIEKASCNVTVQETIQTVRATDKSKTAQTDPMYGDFEKFAKKYLQTEGQSCDDLDATPAPLSKTKRVKNG